MDHNDVKYRAFHDELVKMGGWPAIAAVASRALPAILSAGSKLLKGGAGKKLMGAATVAPMLGGLKKKAPGAVGGFAQRQKPFFRPRFMS